LAIEDCAKKEKLNAHVFLARELNLLLFAQGYAKYHDSGKRLSFTLFLLPQIEDYNI
jgi:hypothetical protein